MLILRDMHDSTSILHDGYYEFPGGFQELTPSHLATGAKEMGRNYLIFLRDGNRRPKEYCSWWVDPEYNKTRLL